MTDIERKVVEAAVRTTPATGRNPAPARDRGEAGDARINPGHTGRLRWEADSGDPGFGFAGTSRVTCQVTS